MNSKAALWLILVLCSGLAVSAQPIGEDYNYDYTSDYDYGDVDPADAVEDPAAAAFDLTRFAYPFYCNTTYLNHTYFYPCQLPTPHPTTPVCPGPPPPLHPPPVHPHPGPYPGIPPLIYVVQPTRRPDTTRICTKVAGVGQVCIPGIPVYIDDK